MATKEKANSVPFSGELDISIAPTFIKLHKRFTMTSPNLVPPCNLVDDASHWLNLLNYFWAF
ncbi:hypothetical protein PPHE_b0429 [Pseudoalteromonas phenolica O-BC30]|nr:hypothetical protein [Pseudoalteromonas phenolica]MBE0357162.1 hypothetical protein [Pseudoalteromonas phenolica O-BC30]